MTETSPPIVIFFDELVVEMRGRQPCSTCKTPLGIVVPLTGDEPGEWTVVVPHGSSCPHAPTDKPGGRHLRVVGSAS